MTPDQHRAIGRILGFPECCVEAWVNDHTAAGIRRGCIVARHRTLAEARALYTWIMGEVAPPWAPDALTQDLRVCWVPCDACAAKRDAGGFAIFNPFTERYMVVAPTRQVA